MLAERHWPGAWIVVRTFGVFFIYATMCGAQMRSATVALAFLVGSTACHAVAVAQATKTPPHSKRSDGSAQSPTAPTRMPQPLFLLFSPTDAADVSQPGSPASKPPRWLPAYPLLALCGLWQAVNTVVFITAVGKLHPMRASIGEFALFSIVEPSSPSWGALPLGVRRVSCAVAGVMLLTWANISPDMPAASTADGRGGSRPMAALAHEEDRILAVDSIGGMVLLLCFAASEHLRLMLRHRLVVAFAEGGGRQPALFASLPAVTLHGLHSNGFDSAGHVADLCAAAVGAAGVFAGSVLFTASHQLPWLGGAADRSSSSRAGDAAASSSVSAGSDLGAWATGIDGGSSSFPSGKALVQLLLCTLLVVAVPTLLLRGNAKFRFVTYSRWHMSLKVVLATATAFVLHVTFHVHYSPQGEVLVEAAHPATHFDNLLIVTAGCVLAFGLLRAGSGSGGSLHTGRPGGMGDGYDTSSSSSSGGGGGYLFPHEAHGDYDATLVARIMEHPEQRKLACFLGLTFLFMLVELVYGMQANSIGLVSDSFHMLLDSASIAIGLYAAFMASWPKSDAYPFGYGRFEVLSGFTNGVLLLAIAVFIFLESAARVLDPPEVDSEHLLFVSICGLTVNVIGVVFFHEAHAHGHSVHSHGDDDDHGGGSCCGGSNQNMRGVYLHILADLLGSVSVIASSVIVKTTGWMASDPLCSLLISTFIFCTAWPLVTDTGRVLLQGLPNGSEVERRLRRAVVAAAIAVVEEDDGHPEGKCDAARHRLPTVLHCRAWVHAKDVMAVDIRLRMPPQVPAGASVAAAAAATPALSGATRGGGGGGGGRGGAMAAVRAGSSSSSSMAIRRRVLDAVRHVVGRHYAASIDEFTTIEVEM